ncbi:unnamed protein product [Somion occarium]|uniref:Uncharacterized protein n=1 Tax=Somion occarium TaxID=3059160 RepID=A0ABP1D9Z3_9APHY
MPFVRSLARPGGSKRARSVLNLNSGEGTAGLEALQRIRSCGRTATTMRRLRFLQTYIMEKTGSEVRSKQLTAYLRFVKNSRKKSFARLQSRNPAKHPQRRQPNSNTTSFSKGPVTSSSNVKPPASMSRRRLASNRPALRCLVDLPPIPTFSTPTALPPPSLSSNAFLPTTVTSGSIPVTPVTQIMHTPDNPPPQTQDATCKPTGKLKLNIDTIKSIHPGRSTVRDPMAVSPYLPFTPLDTPTLHASLEGDVYPFDLTQRLSGLKMGMTPSPPYSRLGKPPSPSSARKTPRRLPFTLPRRLSYRLSAPLSPSPLSMLACRGLRASDAITLASPLDIQKHSFHPKKSVGVAESPKGQAKSCSPAPNDNSPLGYFTFVA